MRASPPTARRLRAFTLIEVLVAMTVLVLMLGAITLLFNGALAAIGLNNKHSDADAQARAVFDRMAVDFSQMVRRPDVDYYLKNKNSAAQAGNDQLAFYSQVPGYYLPATAGGTPPATGTQSPVSLVAYRINSDSSSTAYNKLERLGYGLLWSGASTSTQGVMFSLPPTSTSELNSANTIKTYWPLATDSTTDTPSHYELASSQVIRMEYYYILRGEVLADGVTVLPPVGSLTPWDVRMPVSTPPDPLVDHTSVMGLRDVAAIVVTLALVDSRSRINTTDAKLAQLAATMPDVDEGTGGSDHDMTPGNLEASWQAIANNGASIVGRPAAAGIRIYQRTFNLPQNPTP